MYRDDPRHRRETGRSIVSPATNSIRSASAASALGIARGMIDAFLTLPATKVVPRRQQTDARRITSSSRSSPSARRAGCRRG